ncbi:MAG: DNA-3-methyladenine glycosylase family protein [Alphaproteobacteria bacterium]
MRTIETEADIDEGLTYIEQVDPRLSPVIAAAGKVPLRRRPAGFSGLLNIIVSQQLSAASANAIWRRIELAIPDHSPDVVIEADDDRLRSMGLSMPKIRAIRAAAVVCRDGLDLQTLAQMPPDEARAALTAIKGVGPWTADIYLLFCLGHADVFPVGDLALRIAVAEAIGAQRAPTYSELVDIAALWSPWRGVAACLFWAYYRTLGAEQRASISTDAKKRPDRR